MTAEDLLKQSKEILSYSPHTGKFTYIQKRKRMDIGDTAGSLNKAGYIQLNLFGKVYAAHRIAFLFMTGQWPIGVIDHKDLDKTNNKWTNLRDVTSSVNIRNQAKRKNNTSGKTGVAWNKREGKWHAYIYADGKCKTLGYFDYKEDAIFARMTAEKNLGFWVDKVCEVD